MYKYHWIEFWAPLFQIGQTPREAEHQPPGIRRSSLAEDVSGISPPIYFHPAGHVVRSSGLQDLWDSWFITGEMGNDVSGSHLAGPFVPAQGGGLIILWQSNFVVTPKYFRGYSGASLVTDYTVLTSRAHHPLASWLVPASFFHLTATYWGSACARCAMDQGKLASLERARESTRLAYGHMASVKAAQLCCWSTKAATDDMQMNEFDCMPIKLNLQNQ